MTIQREPSKVNAVLDELRTRIADEEAGRVDTVLRGGSFEAEVFWLVRNMDIERSDLLRAAAGLVKDIILHDISAKDS